MLQRRIIALSLLCAIYPLFVQATTKDRSAEFAYWYSQEDEASQISSLPAGMEEKLHKYFFLIVPGILSDYMDFTIGEFHMETENRFMDFLSKHGLVNGMDFKKINLQAGYSGEAGPEANTAAISDAIQRAKKPVLLFTHSKGSVDSLVTLLEHSELRRKVAGWVASQSPFYGSPIADQVCAHPIGGIPAAVLFNFFGGSQAGLRSLQVEERSKFMRTHDTDVASITKEIPTLSFASFIQTKKLTGWMSIINILYGKEMETLYPDDHDGLVPVNSTQLPGAETAVFEGLNHLSNNLPQKPYTALAVLLLEDL